MKSGDNSVFGGVFILQFFNLHDKMMKWKLCKFCRKGGIRLKRRILSLILCCLIVFGCAVTVSAESAASYIENITTVTSDGDCMVTLRVNIHLESPAENMTFPLPLGATNISVNNSSASTTKTANAIQVNLGRQIGGLIGDHTVKFDYNLSGIVSSVEDEETKENKLILQLPLINGFSYPVQGMEFAITLPGQIETRPTFTASYQQSSTESNLEVVVQGNMISGVIKEPLMDHETMVMTMEVSEEMFPKVNRFQRKGNPEIIPMIICAGLAFVYWLLALRTFPIIRSYRATPPEGVCAGEMGCRLTFAGADLTMMVFTWAQLGYLLIQVDKRGRVILYKRMDMGNERSLFEIKCFRSLFGKRQSVDGTGYQYARLCRKFARHVPGERAMCKKGSGSTKLFRIISCGIGVFGGICLAMNMTGILVLQVLLAVIFAVFGAVSAWKIQEGMYRLHLRGKLPLIISLALSAVWLLIGLIAGQIVIALCIVLAQLLTGLAAAYGGRRNDMGRQNAAQILGLRQYLKKISKEDLKRIQKNDPEYFFNMAPYALALGIEKQFARNFGKQKLGQCPYLVTSSARRMSVQSWAQLMRRTADLLDERHRRMEWEKYAIIKIQ